MVLKQSIQELSDVDLPEVWTAEMVKDVLLKIVDPAISHEYVLERSQLLGLVRSEQFVPTLLADWPEFNAYPINSMEGGFISIGRVLTELVRMVRAGKTIYSKENWPKISSFGPFSDGDSLTSLTFLRPPLVDVADAYFKLSVEGFTSSRESSPDRNLSVSGSYRSIPGLYVSEFVGGVWIETPIDDDVLLVETFAKLAELSLLE